MLVRALEACFTGGSRRRKGEEFEYEGKELPAHLVPVKKGDVVQKPEETSPVALSQIGMAELRPKSFVEVVAKGKSKHGPDKV